MLNSKRLLGCTILAFSMAFSGCASLGVASGEMRSITYDQAVQSGIIALVNEVEVKQSDYDLAEVTYGRLFRQMELPVRIAYPIQRNLSFTQSGGRIKGVYVSANRRVQKGDVLAEIIFAQDELQAERDQLMVRINQFEQQRVTDQSQRLVNIENHRNNIPAGMDTYDMEIHRLQLEKLTLEYDEYLRRSALTAEQYYKQLADLDEKLQGEQIIAPFDGLITYANELAEGTEVGRGQRIFTLADTNMFNLLVEGNVEVVRFGDIVEISDGEDIHFQAQVISDPLAPRVSPRISTGNYLLQPLEGAPELSVLAARGRRLNGQFISFDIQNALLMPQSAVITEDARQYVYIYEDGLVKKRYIQTGMNYLEWVQVLSGLEEGQLVVLN